MDAREQGAGIVLLSERNDRVTAADAGLVLMPAAGKRLFPQTGPQPQLYPMWPCPASRPVLLACPIGIVVLQRLNEKKTKTP